MVLKLDLFKNCHRLKFSICFSPTIGGSKGTKPKGTGQKGPKISVEFPAGSNGQFKAPFEPAQNELSVSACGQDVIVRANTSLLAKADEEKNHASASLNKALSFKFDIKPCGEQESEEEQVDIAAIQG